MIPYDYDKEKINNADLQMREETKIYFNPEVGKSHMNWGGCYYYKIGTTVFLHIGVNLGTNIRSKIITMPEGFKPKSTIPGWGGGADGRVPDESFVEVFDTGEVWVKSSTKFALILVQYDIFE